MTCIGFSGADILTFREVPITLLNILEIPVFFLHLDFAPLAASSEYLFDARLKPLSVRVGVVSIGLSPAEKLADWRKGVSIRGSGEVCDRCGGAGRRSEF